MTLVVIIGLLAYIAYKIYDFPFAVVNIAKSLTEQNPEPTDERKMQLSLYIIVLQHLKILWIICLAGFCEWVILSQYVYKGE